MPLAVVLITLAGAVLRVAVAGEPLFADELSTYWIVTDHDFGGVLSTVHSNAEITPPLYFALSWITTGIDPAPEMVRAPSLVAGTATIPLVYLLGARTVGRPAALTATALTALSPFMVYYSAEARAYALVMGLVVLSTLAMLLAVDDGRRRWWALYAASSCAAMYSHYTAAFVLAAQLLWLAWAHPEARRAALLANGAAAVAFLPWITGLRNDLDSPTADILDALSPFTPGDVRVALEHWAFGYPYAFQPLRTLPGVAALVALGVAVAVSAAAAVRRHTLRWPAASDRRVLIVALLLAVLAGEAAVSVVSTNLFGVRNLAVAWPALALALGALLTASGPRLRYATALVAVAAFAVGAIRMLDDDNERPDYRAAAEFIDRSARPGDVLVDATGSVSPGPLTGMDATLERRIRIYRGAAPEQRDRPFDLRDRQVPKREALERAARAANGGTIYFVASVPPDVPAFEAERRDLRTRSVAKGYRAVASRDYPGVFPVTVDILEPVGG